MGFKNRSALCVRSFPSHKLLPPTTLWQTFYDTVFVQLVRLANRPTPDAGHGASRRIGPGLDARLDEVNVEQEMAEQMEAVQTEFEGRKLQEIEAVRRLWLSAVAEEQRIEAAAEAAAISAGVVEAQAADAAEQQREGGQEQGAPGNGSARGTVTVGMLSGRSQIAPSERHNVVANVLRLTCALGRTWSSVSLPRSRELSAAVGAFTTHE